MYGTVYRFWAISDPVKMDEEASSVQKHRSKEVHPVLNCDKASSGYIVVISYVAWLNLNDISVYCDRMLLFRLVIFFLKFHKPMM